MSKQLVSRSLELLGRVQRNMHTEDSAPKTALGKLQVRKTKSKKQRRKEQKGRLDQLQQVHEQTQAELGAYN